MSTVLISSDIPVINIFVFIHTTYTAHSNILNANRHEFYNIFK